MNVVWMKSEFLFPLDVGGRIRTFNLLKHINREVAITYLGFAPTASPDESQFARCARRVLTVHRPAEHKAGVSFYLRVAANIGSQFPYFVKRNCSDSIRDHLRQTVSEKKCDLVVCDSLDMACNVDFSLKVPKLLFHHGIETALWRQRYESATTTAQRSYFNYEAKRMAAFEGDICNRFDVIIAVSDSDRKTLIDEFKVRVPIEVIPTGVDCEYFKPDPKIPIVPGRLMFSGSMEFLSNIDQLLWFASEIYPLIRQKCPGVTLDIVGRDPAVEIVALGKKDSSIRVTGRVQDIRPYLASADVYIVPLRIPGGTRIKIYEALAMRKPVVSTSYGIEGLALTHGLHVLLADTPREFADAVCDLMQDPTKKTALADRGWRLVNEACDWSVMARRFIQLFNSLLGPS